MQDERYDAPVSAPYERVTDLDAIQRGGPRRLSVRALDSICDELRRSRDALQIHGIVFTTLKPEPKEED